MTRAFARPTFRQVFAAMAVICLGTTAVAQENQQPNEGKKPAANAQQAEQGEGKQGETKQKEDAAKEKEAVVLKVIEFESMSVNDFLSAAQVAGVVDRNAGYGHLRRGLGTQQRAGAQQRSNDQQRLYLGFQPDSSLLFVRGKEKEVNKIEALAKKLDVAPDKMPETLRFENGKQARRIPQAEMTDVKELLGSLGLETSTAIVGEAHFLVFEESDETNVKQIEQVLEKLIETREKEESPEGDAEREGQRKEKAAKGDTEGKKGQPEEKADQEKQEQENDSKNDR